MASLSLGGKIINDLINLTKLHPQPTRLPADFHCVHWPGSFGLHWFLQILSNCYSRSQTAPIRIVLVHPTRSWSKSKTRGGQRHSWSVALRPHEQPMSLASPPTPPPPSLRSFCQRWTGVDWRWSVSLMSQTKWVYTEHTWDLMNTFFNQTFVYSSCIC